MPYHPGMIDRWYLDALMSLVDEAGASAGLSKWRPGERPDEEVERAVYFRTLLSHFRANDGFRAELTKGVWRNRVVLRRLLSVKAPWPQDGGSAPVQSLAHAMLGGFAGLRTPRGYQDLAVAIEQFAPRPEPPPRVLRDARELAYGSGLRAPWGPSLVLAAWLRYLSAGRQMPRSLRPRRVDPWPAGPFTVLNETPTVRVADYWDPRVETRDSVRERLRRAIDEQLDRIAPSDQKRSPPVRARNVQREVEATYLRITDPEQYGWQRLAEHFGWQGSGASERNKGNSPAWLAKVVQRTLSLLEIEKPPKGPGRPPTRKPLS